MRVLAIVVLSLSLVLVTVGSVISSSGYGLSIPDWPLAQGSLIPDPLVGGIAWAFAHRALSLITGLATLLLGGLLLTNADALLRRLGTAMMAIVLVQILVGGLGVLQEFPWLLKVMHGSLAHLFVGVAAAAVAMINTGVVPAANELPDPAAIRRTRAFSSMLLLQLVAGAVVRHAETQAVMIGALLLHLLLAIGIAITGISIALRLGSALSGWRSRVAYAIGAGIVVQVLLGFTVFVSAPEPGAIGQQSLSYIWHAGSHVVVGALLLACGSALYLRLSARCGTGGAEDGLKGPPQPEGSSRLPSPGGGSDRP